MQQRTLRMVRLLANLMRGPIIDIVSDNLLSSAEKIAAIEERFNSDLSYYARDNNGLYRVINRAFLGSEHALNAYAARTQWLAVNEAGSAFGWTLLGAAAREGDLAVMRWLIENQQANVHLGNENNTALCIAAQYGQIEAMRYLISKGADVSKSLTVLNGEDYTINALISTPLHKAVTYGRIEAAKLLLSHNPTLQYNWRVESVLDHGAKIVEILTSLQQGIAHERTAYYFDAKGSDRSPPPIQNVSTILHLLKNHFNSRYFYIKTTAEKEEAKEAKQNDVPSVTVSEESKKETKNEDKTQDDDDLRERKKREERLRSKIMQKESKAAEPFIKSITGIAVFFNHAKPYIPADTRSSIIQTLYGSFEEGSIVAQRTVQILQDAEISLPNPEENKHPIQHAQRSNSTLENKESASQQSIDEKKHSPNNIQNKRKNTNHPLAYDLQNYIKRIESYTSKTSSKLNYAHGFWICKNSRALNRKANYFLAKRLLKNPDLDIDKERADIWKSMNANPEDNHGINSRELNDIIRKANTR
jgi:ankyrin repeat protein